jgi:hypothetical protein
VTWTLYQHKHQHQLASGLVGRVSADVAVDASIGSDDDDDDDDEHQRPSASYIY